MKRVKGHSLAELAVTTAMMATWAATAAPQFGSVGEGAKEKKTMNNIDKIVQAANNYYNQKLDEEGRGRFPGQVKYDEPVGSAPNIDLNVDPTVAEGLATFVDVELSALDDFEDTGLNQFVYVFANADTGQNGPDQDPQEGFQSRIWRGKMVSKIVIFFLSVVSMCKDAIRGSNL